eukprot:403336088
MSKKNQKRSLKETETVEIVQEDEEKITISKKKTTTMSRTTTKGQSSLSGFFGVTHNPSAKFHGDAKHEDFKSDQLNIWVWNINGLQAVINKGMLDVFLQGEDPDIVCFNEIKTDPEKIKSASFHTKIPKDYEQYWNCSKSKKGYSGTGLITKIKPIKVTFDIGIEEHDQEGRVITAEFSKFVLVAVYVPNSGDDLRRLSYRTQEWDKAFFDYLDRTRIETNKPLILTGDLNVARNELDVFDTKGKDKVACYTPEERKSFESFINRGYIDTFRHLYPDKREYTYFSARFNNKVTNKGWRIDYFVVHQDDINMVTDVTIHKDYNGSDHVPVCLHLDLSKIKETKPNDTKLAVVNDTSNKNEKDQEEEKASNSKIKHMDMSQFSYSKKKQTSQAQIKAQKDETNKQQKTKQKDRESSDSNSSGDEENNSKDNQGINDDANNHVQVLKDCAYSYIEKVYKKPDELEERLNYVMSQTNIPQFAQLSLQDKKEIDKEVEFRHMMNMRKNTAAGIQTGMKDILTRKWQLYQEVTDEFHDKQINQSSQQEHTQIIKDNMNNYAKPAQQSSIPEPLYYTADMKEEADRRYIWKIQELTLNGKTLSVPERKQIKNDIIDQLKIEYKNNQSNKDQQKSKLDDEYKQYDEEF